MQRIPKAEYARRRKALMAQMEPNSIAILPAAPVYIRNRDVEHIYRQDSDFQYLTGFPEPEAVMALIPGREHGEFVLRSQPVFCLMPVRVQASLQEFLASGQRKIDRWTAQHRTVLVPFDRAQDDPTAFANINTLAELNSLPPAP